MGSFTYDHLHFRSVDPESAAEFYERMFGVKARSSIQNGELRLELYLGGARMLISPAKMANEILTQPKLPCVGMEHFGLAVSNIEAVVADLKAKGAEFVGEPSFYRPGVKIAFMRGPDGVLIELIDRAAA